MRNTTGTIWKAVESGIQWYPDFLDQRRRHTEKSHLTPSGRWAARPPTWQTYAQCQIYLCFRWTGPVANDGFANSFRLRFHTKQCLCYLLVCCNTMNTFGETYKLFLNDNLSVSMLRYSTYYSTVYTPFHVQGKQITKFITVLERRQWMLICRSHESPAYLKQNMLWDAKRYLTIINCFWIILYIF